MKGIITLTASLVFYSYGLAQVGLTVSGSVPVFIAGGSTLSVDGLVLAPSAGCTIAAPNGVVRNTASSHPAGNSYISRVYSWNNPLPSFSGTITVYYQVSELNGIPEANLTLNAYDGSGWGAYNTGITRDQVNHFVATASLNNAVFQELTLANSGFPLPLRWGPVNAYRDGNSKTTVEWTTYDELNVKSYQVEKSLDGQDWVVQGPEVSAANTTGEHHYKQEDPSAVESRIFYRIKESDLDGRMDYSHIVTLDPIQRDNVVQAYPNPAKNWVTIHATTGIVSIRIMDVNGNVLGGENAGGTAEHLIDVSMLPAGVYWLQITLSDRTTTKEKIIKI